MIPIDHEAGNFYTYQVDYVGVLKQINSLSRSVWVSTYSIKGFTKINRKAEDTVEKLQVLCLWSRSITPSQHYFDDNLPAIAG